MADWWLLQNYNYQLIDLMRWFKVWRKSGMTDIQEMVSTNSGDGQMACHIDTVLKWLYDKPVKIC